MIAHMQKAHPTINMDDEEGAMWKKMTGYETHPIGRKPKYLAMPEDAIDDPTNNRLKICARE
jgi:hypothetical protein